MVSGLTALFRAENQRTHPQERLIFILSAVVSVFLLLGAGPHNIFPFYNNLSIDTVIVSVLFVQPFLEDQILGSLASTIFLSHSLQHFLRQRGKSCDEGVSTGSESSVC